MRVLGYLEKVLINMGSYSTHISLVSFLWHIGKPKSPRCDATKRGVPSEAILFAVMYFIGNEIKMKFYS